LEAALGAESSTEVFGMFASYGLGGIVAGVLLYMMYRFAQRILDSQEKRDEWDRDSRSEMYKAINNLALHVEHQTVIITMMIESVGRLPCSSDEEVIEAKRMSQGRHCTVVMPRVE
jgi:uncharacterized membrane-anchored protein